MCMAESMHTSTQTKAGITVFRNFEHLISSFETLKQGRVAGTFEVNRKEDLHSDSDIWMRISIDEIEHMIFAMLLKHFKNGTIRFRFFSDTRNLVKFPKNTRNP